MVFFKNFTNFDKFKYNIYNIIISINSFFYYFNNLNKINKNVENICQSLCSPLTKLPEKQGANKLFLLKNFYIRNQLEIQLTPLKIIFSMIGID